LKDVGSLSINIVLKDNKSKFKNKFVQKIYIKKVAKVFKEPEAIKLDDLPEAL